MSWVARLKLGTQDDKKFVRGVLFGANTMWHSMAAYYFLFQTRRILKYFTKPFPTDLKHPHPHTIDMMRFLGAFNCSIVALSSIYSWKLIRQSVQKGKSLSTNEQQQKEAERIAWFVCGVANLSQFLMDCRVHYTNSYVEHQRLFSNITVLDGVFALLDLSLSYFL